MADGSNSRKKDKKGAQSGLAAAGFISFADVMDGRSPSAASSSPGAVMEDNGGKGVAVYQGNHSELGMHCKKVLKKDLVTKMKAVQEINSILANEASAENNLVSGFLPFFTFLFPKLALENEWKVRERFGQLLLTIVSKDKQALTPYMKDIIGPWWQLISDPVLEVSEKFRSAFTAAVPPKKRRAVLLHLIPALMEYIARYLAIETQELREMCVGCSAEELDEKQDRMVLSSITALDEVIRVLSSSAGDSNGTDASNEAFISPLKELLAAKVLLQHGRSKQWSVRRALFKLLVAIAKYQPDILTSSLPAVSKCLLEGLDSAVESGVGVDQVLAAWVELPAQLGEHFWSALPVGAIVKKIFSLRTAHADVLIDHALPFVANLPLSFASVFEQSGEADAQQAAQASKVFRSLVNQLNEWLAFCKTSPGNRKNAGIVAILETAVYMLLRKVSAEHSIAGCNVERAKQLLTLLSQTIVVSVDAVLKQQDSTGSKSLVEKSKDADAKLRNAVIKSLALLQRAAGRQQFFSSADWTELLFDKLYACVLEIGRSDGEEQLDPQIVIRALALLYEAHSASSAMAGNLSTDAGLCALFMQLIQQEAQPLLGNSAAEFVAVQKAMFILSSAVELQKGALLPMYLLFLAKIFQEHTSWLPLLLESLRSESHLDSATTTFNQMLVALEALKLEGNYCSLVATTCVQSGVIIAVSILLQHSPIADNVLWSAESVAMLRSFAKQCLLGDICEELTSQDLQRLSMHQRLKFLLNMRGLQSLQNINEEVLQRAKELWMDKASKPAVWYLLSALTMACRCGAVDSMKWIFAEGFGFQSKLLTLFLGRDRGNEHVISEAGDCVVDSWYSFEGNALSIIPTEERVAFAVLISNLLNEQLSPTAEHRFPPSKWSEHASQYLQLLKRGCFSDECSSVLSLFSSHYWKSLLGSASTDTLVFAVQCLHFILTSNHKHDQDLIAQDTELFLVLEQLMTMLIEAEGSTTEIVLIAQDIKLHLQQAVLLLELPKQVSFITALVNNLENFNLDGGLQFETLQAMLTDSLKHLVPGQQKGSHMIRFTSPLPHPSNAKGLSLQYIAQQTISSDSSSMIHFTLKRAKLVSTHLENGLHRPYYTISIQDGGYVKEVQTEWHRLFISTPTSAEDANDVVDSIDANCNIAVGNTVGSPLVQFLWITTVRIVQDLRDTLFQLSSARAASLARTIDWSAYQRKVELFGVLFDAVVRSNEIDHATIMMLVISVRGCMLNMCSKFGLYPKLMLLAGRMLKSCLQHTAVLGSGIWLSSLLASLWNDLSGDDSTAPNKKVTDRSVVLEGQSWALGAVLQAMEWNSVQEIAARFLLPVLLSIKQSTFPCAQTYLLAQWWGRHHIGPRGSSDYELDATKRAPTDWESSAVQFLMELFVRLTSIQQTIPSSEQLLVDVVVALHGCFVDRPRMEAYRLLSSSLEHIGHLLSLVLLPTSVDLHNALMRRYNPALVDTMRFSAAKLMDMIQTAPTVEGGNVEVIREDDAVKGAEAVEETEADIEADEAAEQEEDMRAFMISLGTQLADQLVSRYDFQHVMQSTQISTEGSGSGIAEENETDSASNDAASDDLSGISSAVNVLSSRQTRAQQREFWHRWSNCDALGSVLAWLLTLQAIDAVKAGSLRIRCSNHLKVSGLFVNALQCLVHLSGDLLKTKDLAALFQRMAFLNYANPEHDGLITGNLQQLAVYAVYRSICILPSLFRYYWNDHCLREQKQKLSKFIEERVRVSILRREIALIQAGKDQGRWDDASFQVQGNLQTGEIQATFIHDEAKIEVTIKLPSTYPLKNVDVTCSSRIGVSDGRWRRWVLQMIQVLSLQDQAVVDAALVWKSNIEQELHGVEACPICYCTLHNKTLKLPSFKCPTCSHKFHPSCLHTWFKSSGKSNCVLCQQPLFH